MTIKRLIGLLFPSPGSFFFISYFRHLKYFPVQFQKSCDKGQLLGVFKIILLSSVLAFPDWVVCFFPDVHHKLSLSIPLSTR